VSLPALNGGVQGGLSQAGLMAAIQGNDAPPGYIVPSLVW
jgi:hypothetical protein